MRALEKKMRQIKLLKEKQEGGKELNEQEEQKLAQEKDINEQLEALSKLVKKQ